MELTDIKIFATVAKMESITKSAEDLGYVQSHVSKRIDKIEKELGCKLFKRTNRGVLLLPKGEELLAYSEKILNTISEMEKAFKISPNTLHIGTTQTISYNYLYSLYLKEDTNIFVRSIKELLQMYNQTLINILILNRPIENLHAKVTQEYFEEISWIKSSLKKDDLFDKPVVVSRDSDCPYAKRTIEYLNKYHKEKLKALITVDNMDILFKMVEENKAIAILPSKSIMLNERIKKLESHSLQNITLCIYYNSHSYETLDMLKLLENNLL